MKMIHFITHSWHFYALNNETFILTHMEEPMFKMNVSLDPLTGGTKTVFLLVSNSTIHTRTALSGHISMVTALQPLSLSLMPWIDIKESLMIKPSAPFSPTLASIHYVHTTLFEYRAPTASNATLQTPFLCFNYWLTRFIAWRHGSVSTDKLTSGPGTFCFLQTNWSIWSVLDAPLTVSLQCWCL